MTKLSFGSIGRVFRSSAQSSHTLVHHLVTFLVFSGILSAFLFLYFPVTYCLYATASSSGFGTDDVVTDYFV